MALALLGFCAITLGHTACIVAYRVAQVLRGFPVTGFKKSRTEPENSLYGRICASHANCLENLPWVFFSGGVLTICFMFLSQSFWHCGPHQQGATPHIFRFEYQSIENKLLVFHPYTAHTLVGFRWPWRDIFVQLLPARARGAGFGSLRQRRPSGDKRALHVFPGAVAAASSDCLEDVHSPSCPMTLVMMCCVMVAEDTAGSSGWSKTMLIASASFASAAVASRVDVWPMQCPGT